MSNSDSPFVNSDPSPPSPKGRKGRGFERFCPYCGRSSDGMLIFCPYCGTNYPQASSTQPSIEKDAPVPEPPQLVDTPQYLPYESVPISHPDGKNLRLAFILALMPGFLGFMGLGHLYMGKWLKGVLLLFLGGFLAMLSMVSIMMLFEPSEFEIGVRVFTAALMSAPYLVLQLWQAFDAPKPNRRMPRDPY